MPSSSDDESSAASGSSSRSSSSSRSLPSVSALIEQSTKANKKSGKKSKDQSISVPSARADGIRGPEDNPHWAYKPPPGAKLIDHGMDAEEFDWDVVKDDDDLELWVIRAPNNLKPKYLEHMSLALPPAASSSKMGRIGNIVRKHASYDVWSVGDSDGNVEEDEAAPHGGEEIKSLRCLLPRRKKSKLYLSSKHITRRIVITSQPPNPSTSSEAASQVYVHQNPPRFSYSKQDLVGKFSPYGSYNLSASAVGDDGDVMTVDAGAAANAESEESAVKVKSSLDAKKHKKDKEGGEVKSKKRKAEEGESGKAKKAKVKAQVDA